MVKNRAQDNPASAAGATGLMRRAGKAQDAAPAALPKSALAGLVLSLGARNVARANTLDVERAMLKKTVCLLLGSALTLPAIADTHITFVDDQGEVSSQIFVKGGKVRVENGETASQGVILYDAASNTITVLMPAEKKYLLFNDAGAPQAEVDQAKQQVEPDTFKLTPEQKARMQQAGSGMQVQAKELGTSESVAGHSCKDVQFTVNDKPSVTMCVAKSPGSLGIPIADLKTLQAMREGMQKTMSQMGPIAQGMAAMTSSGFSLKTTRQSYRNFQAVTQTEIFKSASSAPLVASLFQIPDGYTQTSMEEFIKGGHQ